MRYKTEAQLLDPTKKKWSLYKILDKQIEEIVNKHGLKIIKNEYDNELFVKTIIFESFNDNETNKVTFEVGNILGQNNLKINIISRNEILPTVKKIKYLISLCDPTPEKWKKFLFTEPYRIKLAEEHNVLREYIIYNQNNSTLSVQVEYNDEKSREIFINKIYTLMYKNGLNQEIVEAIEFNDYCDEITDLPFYSVNKLMDKAEQSLEKLSHM